MIARITGALIVCSLCCACPSASQLAEKPRLGLRSVAEPVPSEAGLGVPVVLDLDNPNGFPMSLRAMDWEISIASAPAIRGRTELSQSIPAGERIELRVILAIPSGASNALLASPTPGPRTYHLRSTLHLFSPHGDMGLVFDELGQLGN